VKVALSEASRMADIISRLRETYRPATREEFHPGSLNELVADVQKLLQAHLRRNQVEFRFDPDANLPPIPMLRDQIKQVILNICLNGVEAMAFGGRLTLRTRFFPKRGRVSLTVADTGIGIPADILPNIFDPFVTTKTSGTGLGLAISYDIIQRHNGKIEVDSIEGKGSTFVVWLPIER
jgi:signal transduction histidine kinase